MGGDRTTRLAFISFLRCFCVELFCGILSVQENSGTPSVLSSCRRIFAGVFLLCSFCLGILSMALLFVRRLGCTGLYRKNSCPFCTGRYPYWSTGIVLVEKRRKSKIVIFRSEEHTSE